MEKDPADRYQSAADMRSDIQRALSGFPVAAAMPMTRSYGGPGPGTRRMDPMGQTQLQGQTGSLPPYEYGQRGPDGRPRGSAGLAVGGRCASSLTVIAGGDRASTSYVSGSGGGTGAGAKVTIQEACRRPSCRLARGRPRVGSRPRQGSQPSPTTR